MKNNQHKCNLTSIIKYLTYFNKNSVETTMLKLSRFSLQGYNAMF